MADVVESFEKLLSYGTSANDGCNDGTLFRFEGERWFFLSNADKDALRARLSQAGAGGVVVRPLEWRTFDKHLSAQAAPVGVYGVLCAEGFELRLSGEWIGRFDSYQAAKAAAQADYEARIRSALAASPSAVASHEQPVGETQPTLCSTAATQPRPVQPTASVEAVREAAQALEDGIMLASMQRDADDGNDEEEATIIQKIEELQVRMKAAAEGLLASLTPPATQGDGHPDDLAVDRFAVVMKAKLAKKRAEGRGGWEDKGDCSNAFLSLLLREHIDKGDPVDVGNLAMMIHQRGERIG